MTVTDYFLMFLPLMVSIYFLYLLKTEQKLRGSRGFTSAIFLALFIHKISPIITKWITTTFLSH